MSHRYKQKGFTLIELMVTVAVLAIISAIAIPAYNGYVDSTRHTEGAQGLAAIAIIQEEFFLDNNTYFLGVGAGAIRTASGNLWELPNWNGLLPDAVNEANYNFSYTIIPGITGAIATSYSATATGQNQVQVNVVINIAGP